MTAPQPDPAAPAEPAIDPYDDDAPVADLGELDETARVLEASELARKAEHKLAAGDVGAAFGAIDKAVSLDPSSAEHLALLGYVRGLNAVDGHALREGLAELSRALEQDETLARAFYFRAMLHRRLGQESDARADLDRAAQLDPSDIDVQRELHKTAGTGNFKALDKTRTKTADKAPAVVATADVASPQRRRVPGAVKAMLVVIVAATAYVGGPILSKYLHRPPGPERTVRHHLLWNEADHALGPAHAGPYEHELALDALGPEGARIAVALLADAQPARDEDLRSSKSVQRLAADYLLHYASDVVKKPPPPGADSNDFGALQQAWTAWLAP